MGYIKAERLADYEELIIQNKDLIKDRKLMLQSSENMIKKYQDKLSNATDDYKVYCEDVLQREMHLHDHIANFIKNIEFFQERLASSYEEAKRNGLK